MFGCLFGIFRSIFGVIFGIIIFAGFFAYLMIANVKDNFLSAEFYAESLDENRVYGRIYDEVLVDPEYEKAAELLGDIDVPQEDVARVAEGIIPQDYLQSQIEGAIVGTIDYLNKETDELSIFIDLGPPLHAVKPTLLAYIDERIDGLREVPVETIGELETALEELFKPLDKGEIPQEIPVINDLNALAFSYVDDTVKDLQFVPTGSPAEFQRELEGVYRQLNKGQLPTTVPSVEAIPVSLRGPTFDVVLGSLRNDPSIPPLVVEGLTRERDKIVAQLESGCVTGTESAACGGTGAIQEATTSLIEPVVGSFIDDGFDLAFERLEGDPNFPSVALDGLRARAQDITSPLGEGEIKEALKVGARAVAGPVIDQAIGEIEKELDSSRRLDLVDIAAKNKNVNIYNDDPAKSREDLLEIVDIGRDIIDWFGIGVFITILAVAGGSLLMGLIQIPHMASFFRVPGITLLLTGAVFLILGLVTNSQLSDRLNDLVDQGAEGRTLIPDSMINIISDVLTSMASDVVSGFIVPSISIMVVGFVLIVLSGVIRMLHIPFLSR